MSDWTVTKIKDIGRVVTGKTPPTESKEYFDGDEFFVSPKDLSWEQYYVSETETWISEKAFSKFKNQVLPANAVMFTSLNFAFGKMGLTSKRSLTNQQINSIIVNEANDYKFIFYLLKAYRPIIFSYNSGIDTPIVPKSVFEAIEVVCPPKQTQQKIAAILSTYDDLIANNQRRITLLERMAEDIYREWFVRLRFPGHESVKVEKGIPQGWQFDVGANFFGHVKGKSYGGDELSDNPLQMPFITLKSFEHGGGYRANGLKHYSGGYKPEQVVRQGDIVMAVTDMTQNREVVGRVARVPSIGEKGAVISLDIIKLIPKIISSGFLYSFFRLSGFGDYIKEFANGTNVLHLKPDLVTQQKVRMPPRDLQERFVEIVEPMYRQIDAINLAIAQLERIRAD